MSLLGTLKALGVTARNFFRPTVTVNYPFEPRIHADRYRASFALLHEENGDEACIGCKKCENICPSAVITVTGEKKESPVTGKKRGYASDFVLDLQACIICELCVQVCPVDAIVMCKVQEKPGEAREDLLLTMDRLYRNEKSQPLSLSRGTTMIEAHSPPKEPKPAAPAPPAEPAVKVGGAA